MKNPLLHSIARILPAVVLGFMVVPKADAQIFWAGGVGNVGNNPTTAGGGNWNTSTPNWSTTSGAYNSTNFANGNSVTFVGNAGGTVGVLGTFDVGTVTFSAAAASFTFGSGSLNFNQGSGGIVNNGATQTINSDLTFGNGTSAGTNLALGGTTTFQSGSSAGTGSFTSTADLVFNSGSSLGSATITSDQALFVNGSVTGGSASVINGGTLNLSGASGGLTLSSLNNDSSGLAGSIVTGLNTLTVGSFSLASGAGNNSLGFQLTTPSSTSDGTIVVTGSFLGSGAGETEITLNGVATPGLGLVPYVLIDWTGATATGVALNDFFITPTTLNNAGLAGYRLEVQASQLLLVPEPATFAMPMAAILGLASLRRRKVKATA